MKYAAERPCADPEKAARRILEIANAVEPIQGRIEYGAGPKLASNAAGSRCTNPGPS